MINALQPALHNSRNWLTRYSELASLWTVYLVWGTTFSAIYVGVKTIPPGLFISTRYIAAGIGLILVALLTQKNVVASLFNKETLLRNAVIGLFLFATGNALSAWALQYVPTGLGAMLTATIPFMMLTLSAILPPREPARSYEWLLLAVGFVGFTVMISPQLLNIGSVEPTFWFGALLMNVMALSWSFGSVIARRWPSTDSLLVDVGLQNLFSGLVLFPIVTWQFDWANFHPSSASMLGWLYLVVMGTMVATPCYLYAVKHLPVSVSSSFAYVTPCVTLTVGMLFLGEELTWPMAAGMSLIIASVFVLQQLRAAQHRMPAPDPEVAEACH